MKVTKDNNVITVGFEEKDIEKISKWIDYHKCSESYGNPKAKKIYETKRDIILGHGKGDNAFNIIFNEILCKNGDKKGSFQMQAILSAAKRGIADALRMEFNVDTVTKEDRKAFINDLIKKAIEVSENVDKDFYDEIKSRGYELKFEI